MFDLTIIVPMILVCSMSSLDVCASVIYMCSC